MYSLTTLISFSILAVNVVVTMLCSLLLWRGRHDTSDRSRLFFLLISVSMVVPFIVRLCQLVSNPDEYPLAEVLSPFKVYNGLLYLSLLILYPTEVMRPRWLNPWRTIFFLWPFLLFVGEAVREP